MSRSCFNCRVELENNKAFARDGFYYCSVCVIQRDNKENDTVNHPKHYTNHPSGIECITITEYMNFCLGNAMKYIWRASLKNGLEDLKKAKWYIEREINRLEKS